MSDHHQQSQPNHPQQIIINQSKSQALPALVNVFIPPVGQLIQGRIMAFLLYLVLGLVLNVVVVFATLGFGLIVTLPLTYILCIIDAAKYKG